MKVTEISASASPSRMNSLIFTPASDPENASGNLPLLVYLHGAGERGLVSEHLYRHGVPKLIKEGAKFNAVILVPQCPEWAVWDNVVPDVKRLIDETMLSYGIKRDRVSITGSSMGGYGTFSMGISYPTLFSGIAPVAGGGMAWRASRLVSTPVIAYHGAADNDVLPVYSSLMTDAVNKAGGKAELNLLDGLGHNDGIDYAYRRTDLIERLILLRRTDFSRVKEPCEEYFN